ncbi:GHKL domain-containing protein [Peribacillus psychrosaccharolyticus]|uniref:sensor histidine kinase n=1 Tax=Peribacillus psychrosaccharolyticus TaxID=1407 RepID=UPI003D28A028
MKNKKLKAIIILSILIMLLFMILNVYISYLGIKDSAKKAIANQNIEIAETLASSLDVDAYKVFLGDPSKNKEYHMIKAYLEDARKKIGALHVYTLMIDNPKISKVMVAAMPSDLEAIPISLECTVPQKQVTLAYQDKKFSTDIISDPIYGDYLTVGVPIIDQERVIGFLAIDVSIYVINDISEKVLKSSISNLIFNGFFVILVLVFFIMLHKWYQMVLQKELVETEDTYHSEIQSLLASVQSLRHDVSNHIQVVHGLLRLKEHDKALNYLTTLSEDIHSIESVKLQVKNSGLAVLLETKRLTAQNNNIDIAINLSNDEFEQMKTTDLIKLLSNVIDNAIEASCDIPEKDRRITISCMKNSDKYGFVVKNTGLKIEDINQENLIKSGYSTKKKVPGKVRGQGLFIVNEIVNRYKGELVIQSNDTETIVTMVIPFRK